jgi:hypothetical protein
MFEWLPAENPPILMGFQQSIGYSRALKVLDPVLNLRNSGKSKIDRPQEACLIASLRKGFDKRGGLLIP